MPPEAPKYTPTAAITVTLTQTSNSHAETLWRPPRKTSAAALLSAAPPTDVSSTVAAPPAQPLNRSSKQSVTTLPEQRSGILDAGAHHYIFDAIVTCLSADQPELGDDFAECMRTILYLKETGQWDASSPRPAFLRSIHTVVVLNDHIILLRGTDNEQSLFFKWRQRSGWNALRMMARLREKGLWSCRKIKIHRVQPMTVEGRRRNNRHYVMMQALTKLLRRLRATMEIKLPEYAYFWLMRNTYSLRALTRSASPNVTVRGIPSLSWLPNRHREPHGGRPLLIRQADRQRPEHDAPPSRSRQHRPLRCMYAVYPLREGLPRTSTQYLPRFRDIYASIHQPTLQLFTWNVDQLATVFHSVPRRCPRLDIVLNHKRPTKSILTKSLLQLHQTLATYDELQSAAITFQITAYDDPGWEEGIGTLARDYIKGIVDEAMHVMQGRSRKTRNNDRSPADITLNLHFSLDSFEITSEAIQQTTQTIREGLQQYVQHQRAMTLPRCQQTRQTIADVAEEVTSTGLARTLRIATFDTHQRRHMSVTVQIAALTSTFEAINGGRRNRTVLDDLRNFQRSDDLWDI